MVFVKRTIMADDKLIAEFQEIENNFNKAVI